VEGKLLGGELGGVNPSVAGLGGGKVGIEVGDGALTGDDGLDEEAEHREHGKATVLDLLDLELGEGVRVVGEAEGVEGTSGVEGVKALTGGATVDAVTLDEAHEDDLAEGDGDDGLGVDEVGVAEVVKTTVLEDLGTSLEPDGLTEGGTVLGKELGDDAAESTEHGPAGVDELSLAVSSEGLGIGGEAGGVPSVVTGELTSEVSGGVVGVRTEVLGAVGAVPLDGASRDGAGSLE